jgi:hypothetical protein
MKPVRHFLFLSSSQYAFPPYLSPLKREQKIGNIICGTWHTRAENSMLRALGSHLRGSWSASFPPFVWTRLLSPSSGPRGLKLLSRSLRATDRQVSRCWTTIVSSSQPLRRMPSFATVTRCAYHGHPMSSTASEGGGCRIIASDGLKRKRLRSAWEVTVPRLSDWQGSNGTRAECHVFMGQNNGLCCRLRLK